MKARPRLKRLYRVTARFPDTWIDDDGEPFEAHYTRTWHYQDKRAAQHRARVCREGSPGRPLDLIPSLPAAQSVIVEESNPVTWPEVSA